MALTLLWEAKLLLSFASRGGLSDLSMTGMAGRAA
jgi:hypothetical protein